MLSSREEADSKERERARVGDNRGEPEKPTLDGTAGKGPVAGAFLLGAGTAQASCPGLCSETRSWLTAQPDPTHAAQGCSLPERKPRVPGPRSKVRSMGTKATVCPPRAWWNSAAWNHEAEACLPLPREVLVSEPMLSTTTQAAASSLELKPLCMS